MRRKKNGRTLKFASLFILIVLGLIIISFAIKFLVIIKQSKFDGTNKFVVSFEGTSYTNIVAFSPQNKSISILKVKGIESNISKELKIPIDGTLTNSTDNQTSQKISSDLLKSFLTLGKDLKNLTIIDALRLFLFSRGVPLNSIYQRELFENLSSEQKSTLLSLTFTDPTIYKESQSIQIVNASGKPGLGGRLANLVTNIGGNVILVSTAKTESENSKIIYYNNKSYTVRKLGSYLNFPVEKSDKSGVADVIIIIGKDKIESVKF